MTKKQHIFMYTSIILVMIFSTTFWFISVKSETERYAYPLEKAYAVLAYKMGVPDLCYKIYPYAHHGGLGFNPPGAQDYYWRSQCLQDVALATGNENLCEEIISYPGQRKMYSKKLCIAGIQRGDKPYEFAFEDLEELIVSQAYSQEEVKDIQERFRGDVLMWTHFYKSVAMTEDFQKRAILLPNFSNIHDSENSVSRE